MSQGCRRQSELDISRERLANPPHLKHIGVHDASTPIIKKPQKGLMFYSCTTYEFVK